LQDGSIIHHAVAVEDVACLQYAKKVLFCLFLFLYFSFFLLPNKGTPLMVSIDALTQFKDNHYVRNLIFKSTHVEILLVCWLPGQESPVHGHADSDGLMIILEGELANTTYTQLGQTISTVWTKGSIGHTPVGDKHRVVNNSAKEVISLHIYAPPLERELQGADMGYHNTVEPKETILPDHVIRYFLGHAYCDAGQETLPDSGL
jgi:quercetin dioxygenase-like cupin family protein